MGLPTGGPLTPGPSAFTSPATSLPGVKGSAVGNGYGSFRRRMTSEKFTDAACTRTLRRHV